MCAKIKAPRLPKSLPLAEDMGAIWQEAAYQDGLISHYHFQNIDIAGYDFTGMRFDTVILENCRLLGAMLDKTSFTDVVFDRCDVSNSSLNESYFNRSLWQSCKYLGANFWQSHLSQITITDCNLQYANFDETIWQDAALAGSDCSQAVFSMCRFKGLTFRDCRFIGTNFFQTALRGIDFEPNILEGIIVSDDAHELQGAIVSALQAAELAKLLGLVVKD